MSPRTTTTSTSTGNANTPSSMPRANASQAQAQVAGMEKAKKVVGEIEVNISLDDGTSLHDMLAAMNRIQKLSEETTPSTERDTARMLRGTFYGGMKTFTDPNTSIVSVSPFKTEIKGETVRFDKTGVGEEYIIARRDFVEKFSATTNRALQTKLKADFENKTKEIVSRMKDFSEQLVASNLDTQYSGQNAPVQIATMLSSPSPRRPFQSELDSITKQISEISLPNDPELDKAMSAIKTELTESVSKVTQININDPKKAQGYTKNIGLLVTQLRQLGALGATERRTQVYQISQQMSLLQKQLKLEAAIDTQDSKTDASIARNERTSARANADTTEATLDDAKAKTEITALSNPVTTDPVSNVVRPTDAAQTLGASYGESQILADRAKNNARAIRDDTRAIQDSSRAVGMNAPVYQQGDGTMVLGTRGFSAAEWAAAERFFASGSRDAASAAASNLRREKTEAQRGFVNLEAQARQLSSISRYGSKTNSGDVVNSIVTGGIAQAATGIIGGITRLFSPKRKNRGVTSDDVDREQIRLMMQQLMEQNRQLAEQNAMLQQQSPSPSTTNNSN